MAKQEAWQEDVERDIQAFIEWGTNTFPSGLSDEEIEAKRAELTAQYAPNQMELHAGETELESWEQAEALANDPGTLVLDDYQKLDDKHLLVNVPFMVNRWWFAEGEMGEFAVLRVLTSRPLSTPVGEGSKWVVTDGSTGIHAQLRKITQRTGQSGRLMVRHGLRVSQYTADTSDGPKRAETFYLT